MQAGKLRYLMAIESPTTTQNEFGEPIQAWGIYKDVWVSKEDLTGREYFASGIVIKSEVTTKFTMRYVDGVNERMRLNNDGTHYNITSIADPDGRKRQLVILAYKVP